jgi:hypothetical protein
MKQYASFSEIDKQLKILRLQREINLERFKYNVNRVKSDLYPTQLLGGFKGVIQQTLISFVLNKLLKKWRTKQIEH